MDGKAKVFTRQISAGQIMQALVVLVGFASGIAVMQTNHTYLAEKVAAHDAAIAEQGKLIITLQIAVSQYSTDMGYIKARLEDLSKRQ